MILKFISMSPSTQFKIHTILILTVFFNGCNTNSKASEKEVLMTEEEEIITLTEEQFQSFNMELGSVLLHDFYNEVHANGKFDLPPESKASVSSFYGGSIKELKLLPGEYVKKGQLLFKLENPDFIQMQQDFLEAQGQLDYLKSDFQRQQSLYENKITSEKNFLKAKSDFTVMQVKEKSLKEKLRMMHINPDALSIENLQTSISIVSPINGYIDQVLGVQGDFLNPSSIALTIVDIEHLHLELNIFEKDLPKLEIGQSIEFKLLDDHINTHAAKIYLINKTVDAELRTIGIHGHLADESMKNKFNPGMYVEAKIYTSSETKVALPIESMVETDGKYYVLILKNKNEDGYSFEKKQIEIGEADTAYVEIITPNQFEKKTLFLTKGAFSLISE
jgi:cobalt-zinc-cadmium efflux system membrane fusion protein